MIDSAGAWTTHRLDTSDQHTRFDWLEFWPIVAWLPVEAGRPAWPQPHDKGERLMVTWGIFSWFTHVTVAAARDLWAATSARRNSSR